MLKKILFCLSVMLALSHTHQICAMEKDMGENRGTPKKQSSSPSQAPHIYEEHKPCPNASYELTLPFKVPHPDRCFFDKDGKKTYACINGFEITAYPYGKKNHKLIGQLTCEFSKVTPPKLIVIPKTPPELLQKTEETTRTGTITCERVNNFAEEGSSPLLKYLLREALPEKRVILVNFSEINLVYPILTTEEREDLLRGIYKVLTTAKEKGVTFATMKSPLEDPVFCIISKWSKLEIENSSKNPPENSNVVISEFCDFFIKTYGDNLNPISTKNFMEAYKSLTDNCCVTLFLDILWQLNDFLKPPLKPEELQSTLMKYLPKKIIVESNKVCLYLDKEFISGLRSENAFDKELAFLRLFES